MATLLSVRSLNTYYGESHVLQGVDMAVAEGSVVALLGRNGAGKTTTLTSIMGISAPRSGEVVFDGFGIAGLKPHQVARLGIGYVPEDRGIFSSLSVEEHLTLVERPGPALLWNADTVYKTFPRLRERRTHGGGELSGGEQQMLSIARALMLNPRLLILDEPTEGLAPVVTEEIAAVITGLKDAGMTMIIVEQNYPFAMALADKVLVLGKGRVRFDGTSNELSARADIQRTWIGV